MKPLLTLLLSLFFLSARAQCDTAALRGFFLESLRGGRPALPEQRFPVGRIGECRAAVWAAWCRAYRQSAGPQLPPLQPLDSAETVAWAIPSSLEPHAVMPFCYGSKGTAPAAGYPLFIYLHGSGPKQREWETGLRLCRSFDDAPSAYIVPQIPNEGPWYRWWQRGKQHVWERMLRSALASGSVDPDRIYIFGISEGGYGSQRLASFYADYWAAAGPMAGGEPLRNAPAENLCNTGFSLLTGADDAAFHRNRLTALTAEALDSLENLYPAGYRHRVRLIPDKGHFIDYSSTTPWLSLFTRNPVPKHLIWEDYAMDGRHREGFANLWVIERPDSALPTRYDVHIDGNEVRVTVENVSYTVIERDERLGIDLRFSRGYEPATSGRFVLFLSEEQVDLTSRLRVVVNGRQVFAGKPRPDVRCLAQSALLFGDPRRLFPAAVEVEIE